VPVLHPDLGQRRVGVARERVDVRTGRRVAPETLAGQPTGAQRQRPGDVGLLVHTGRDLERPPADVEHQQPPGRPAEPAPYGQERQPRLVLAAEDVQLDAGLAADPVEDLGHVLRVAHRRCHEGDQLADVVVGRGAAGRADRLDEGVRRVVGQCAVGADALGQAQHRLLRVRRPRVRARAGVDHEQVHSVRAHVENTHARHAVSLWPGARGAPDLSPGALELPAGRAGPPRPGVPERPRTRCAPMGHGRPRRA
jgi:hypothetical protein